MVHKSNSWSFPVNSMWRQTHWQLQHSTNMGASNLLSPSILPPGLLTINGCTITRQFAKAIHNQQHLAPLRQYYQLRFNWSCDVFVDIAWSQYSMAYRQFPRQRTFFSKLGWKKLPVAGRLHKRTPCYDHRCPTCATDHEDDDHVYQCQLVTRSQWRTSFLDKIYDKLCPILDPNLMAIIRIGI
jgi:hypothetical protein